MIGCPGFVLKEDPVCYKNQVETQWSGSKQQGNFSQGLGCGRKVIGLFFVIKLKSHT
jgi:hypothetical protein